MSAILEITLDGHISSVELPDRDGGLPLSGMDPGGAGRINAESSSRNESHLPESVKSRLTQEQILGPMQQARDLENQKNEVARLCQMLKCLVDKFGCLYDEIIVRHKEEIAKLSVEIARKILIHKVEERDYQIETIVKEALKNAPTQQQVLVHLNPDDLKRLQQLQQAQDSHLAGARVDNFAGIKFVSDIRIQPADCLIETPKGIIKSFIDEHIEQISEALVKVK